MANNDYIGSLAQQYINFSINTTINTALGTNFQTPIVFIADDDAVANIVAPVPGISESLIVNFSNYTTLTQGTLLAKLAEFFAVNTISEVYIIVFDHATGGNDFSGLTTAFQAWKAYGYFKTLFETTPSGLVTLASLCDNDPVLSQCWIGTDDADCLDAGSVTSIAYDLNTANVAPHLEYHATAYAPELAQLGLSLAVLNQTGYAVGNSLDYKATSDIDSSGTAGANLSAAYVNALKAQFIGYWATIGNNSGQVAQYGGKLLDGNLAGAGWVTSFVEYMSSALGAQYLTDPAQNHYRNNDTYQALLTILRSVVVPLENIGKISNFKITAPAFSSLPVTGDSIIVPNAWTAVYNDNVRSTTIQGNLVVTI